MDKGVLTRDGDEATLGLDVLKSGTSGGCRLRFEILIPELAAKLRRHALMLERRSWNSVPSLHKVCSTLSSVGMTSSNIAVIHQLQGNMNMNIITYQQWSACGKTWILLEHFPTLCLLGSASSPTLVLDCRGIS